jgi:Esterase-like activity of phytase
MNVPLNQAIFRQIYVFIRQVSDRIFTLKSCSLSIGLCTILLITSCSLPQVSAESRLFLDLSLTYLAEYQLPQTEVEGTTVGGFSSLAYDGTRDRIYALAGDRPRVYTLSLTPPALSSSSAASSATDFDLSNLKPITVEAVTPLIEADPSTTPIGTGLALTPRGTVFMLEEQSSAPTPPRLSEFKLASGTWQQNLPLPKQYGDSLDNKSPLGVQPHHGLKALAISVEGDRLFAATEAPLTQDLPSTATPQATRYSRLLHYWIAEPEPLLISEHLYPLKAPTEDRQETTLTDVVPIDNAGHFLGLERTYSPSKGYSATIYQFVTGIATDTSQIRTLPADISGLAPIMKKPLLDLDSLRIPLQSLEGMTLGPYLADGSQSIVIVGNNGLLANRPTQFLLLRLAKHVTQSSS